MQQVEQRDLSPVMMADELHGTSKLRGAIAYSTVAVVLIALLLNVVGQAVLKVGMTQIGPLRISVEGLPTIVLQIVTSPYIIGGLFIYALAMFFWLVTLSRLDLSVAYPSLSLTQVMVLAIAWLVLREEISPLRVGGVLLICLGMLLVARS
ncbi:MAG: multidrug resistance protein [Chloroflexaceae bacterium]|nr:multidrug resistance protein [Chloroflexaceae bacterium]